MMTPSFQGEVPRWLLGAFSQLVNQQGEGFTKQKIPKDLHVEAPHMNVYVSRSSKGCWTELKALRNFHIIGISNSSYLRIVQTKKKQKRVCRDQNIASERSLRGRLKDRSLKEMGSKCFRGLENQSRPILEEGITGIGILQSSREVSTEVATVQHRKPLATV